MDPSPATRAPRACAGRGGVTRTRDRGFARPPSTLLGLVTLWWCALLTSPAPGSRDGHSGRERGDVPGWVMITLMTAGLVVALWAIAGDRLAALFTQALDAVTKVL